jgi:anti-sigma factor RsiW
VSSPSNEANGHVTDTELAAYLDRTLTPSERDRVEDHLAGCPDCRQQLLETKKLLERVRRPRTLLVGGALAAAAVLIFLVVRPESGTTDQHTLMRSDGAAGPLVAYGPLGTTASVGLKFVWSAAPDRESYRLNVSRMDGQPVWSSSGTDTMAILPSSVVLRPNERYYWVVDALLSDGTSRSTGLREFGIAR